MASANPPKNMPEEYGNQVPSLDEMKRQQSRFAVEVFSLLLRYTNADFKHIKFIRQSDYTLCKIEVEAAIIIISYIYRPFYRKYMKRINCQSTNAEYFIYHAFTFFIKDDSYFINFLVWVGYVFDLAVYFWIEGIDFIATAIQCLSKFPDVAIFHSKGGWKELYKLCNEYKKVYTKVSLIICRENPTHKILTSFMYCVEWIIRTKIRSKEKWAMHDPTMRIAVKAKKELLQFYSLESNLDPSGVMGRFKIAAKSSQQTENSVIVTRIICFERTTKPSLNQDIKASLVEAVFHSCTQQYLSTATPLEHTLENNKKVKDLNTVTIKLHKFEHLSKTFGNNISPRDQTTSLKTDVNEIITQSIDSLRLADELVDMNLLSQEKKKENGYSATTVEALKLYSSCKAIFERRVEQENLASSARGFLFGDVKSKRIPEEVNGSSVESKVLERREKLYVVKRLKKVCQEPKKSSVSGKVTELIKIFFAAQRLKKVCQETEKSSVSGKAPELVKISSAAQRLKKVCQEPEKSSVSGKATELVKISSAAQRLKKVCQETEKSNVSGKAPEQDKILSTLQKSQIVCNKIERSHDFDKKLEQNLITTTVQTACQESKICGKVLEQDNVFPTAQKSQTVCNEFESNKSVDKIFEHNPIPCTVQTLCQEAEKDSVSEQDNIFSKCSEKYHIVYNELESSDAVTTVFGQNLTHSITQSINPYQPSASNSSVNDLTDTEFLPMKNTGAIPKNFAFSVKFLALDETPQASNSLSTKEVSCNVKATKIQFIPGISPDTGTIQATYEVENDLVASNKNVAKTDKNQSKGKKKRPKRQKNKSQK